jgi:hypothetical protein
MIKDEALHKALKVLNCLNNNRVYETAWVKGAINACEEALELPAWQGLTDDEIIDMYFQANIYPQPHGFIIDFIRAIEQALRIKNDYQS